MISDSNVRFTLFNLENPEGFTISAEPIGKKQGGAKKDGNHTGLYSYKQPQKNQKIKALFKQGASKKSFNENGRKVFHSYGETIAEFLGGFVYQYLGISAAKSSLASVETEDGYEYYVTSEYESNCLIPPIDGFQLFFKERPKFAGSKHQLDLIKPLEQLDEMFSLGLTDILASTKLQNDEDSHSGNFILIINKGDISEENLQRAKDLAARYRDEINQLIQSKSHWRANKKEITQKLINKHTGYIRLLKELGAEVYFQKIDHGYSFYHIAYEKPRLIRSNHSRPMLRSVTNLSARPTDHFLEYTKTTQAKANAFIGTNFRRKLIEDDHISNDFRDQLIQHLNIVFRVFGYEGLVSYLRWLGNKTIDMRSNNMDSEALIEMIATVICTHMEKVIEENTPDQGECALNMNFSRIEDEKSHPSSGNLNDREEKPLYSPNLTVMKAHEISIKQENIPLELSRSKPQNNAYTPKNNTKSIKFLEKKISDKCAKPSNKTIVLSKINNALARNLIILSAANLFIVSFSFLIPFSAQIMTGFLFSTPLIYFLGFQIFTSKRNFEPIPTPNIETNSPLISNLISTKSPSFTTHETTCTESLQDDENYTQKMSFSG